MVNSASVETPNVDNKASMISWSLYPPKRSACSESPTSKETMSTATIIDFSILREYHELIKKVIELNVT